ncbi:MAG: hypothetical protein ACETWM_21870 [Candidatus Lokiarchaeia archaeon]
MNILDILLYSLNVELLITILMLVLIATILWRFFKKRNLALLYLALFFILFALGVYFASVGHRYQLSMISVIIQDYMLYGVFVSFNVQQSFYATIADWTIMVSQGYLIGSIITLGLSIVLADIGCFFLFTFTLKAFLEKKKKWMLLYSLFFVAAFILTILNLPSLNRTLTSMIALMIGLVSCIPLAYLAIRAARLTKAKLYRYGFQMIAISTVFLILFFLFNFAEGAVIGEFSIFMPLAWTMGLVSSISAYIGYVLPNWFRKLIGEKPEEIVQA